MKTPKVLLAVMAAVAAAAFAVPVQAFPEKPVAYIIPFGPGGESDISARHQQPFFKKMFGQDLVISYKPGGGGAVAWSVLNGMKADGYTIVGTNLPHIVLQPLQKDVGYTTDGLANFIMFHYTPDALVVSKDSPFTTLKDYVEYAKKNPGKLMTSGSGRATSNHLAQVTFDGLAGIKTSYVAFKGTGASVQALFGKQVMASWGYTTVGAKHADKTRMLAVAMEQRHPQFPDVPTFKEIGYDLVGGAYRGIAVPKSTPKDVQAKLSDMFLQINKDTEFRKKMLADGFAMIDVGANDMKAFMDKKKKEYAAAAKAAGILR